MRWSWSGAVAMVLALCVGGGFFLAMWGVTFQETPITSQGSALLNTLGGALIGGVVSWLGRGVADREERPADRTPTRGTTTMSTTPDEPRDPATDPKRDLNRDPQELGDTPGSTGGGEPDDAEPGVVPSPQTPPSTEGDEADGQPITTRR